ncbi:hypothetical protein [Aeromicrobium sp.]|uniref:hypothetical protein n=1 Tax=Aeromicrobium sp. TaxID=1871063 RepID=UPI002FCA644A
MAGKETNNFKRALGDALGVIEEARTSLEANGGIGESVKTKIATHEGWVCDAADDWIADFTAKCSPIMGEFDTAWTELDSMWRNEPDEVDEGNWRGNSYNASGHRPSNIPV